MDKNKKFISDTVSTIVRQMSNILLGVLLIVILARYLQPEGQGQYSLITLLPLLLVTFLTLGLNTSTTYFISKGNISVSNVIKTNILVSFILSGIAVAFGFIFIYFFSGQFFKGIDVSLLYLVLAALPFMFIKEMLMTVFHGLQDFKSFNKLMVYFQAFLLIWVALLVILGGLGINGAIIAFVLANIIIVITIFYYLRKKKVDVAGGEFDTLYLKKAINYGIKAHISNAMTFLNYRLDILILGYFVSSASVGLYTVSVNVGERITILAVAISSVLFPRISSTTDKGERDKVTAIVSRNIAFITLIGGIFAFLLSDLVFELFFGSQYEKSSLLLKILLPGIMLLAVEKVLSNDIAGRGKPELNMYVAIINVVGNVTLNLILVPKIGVSGAAYATTISYFFSFIIKIVIFHRITGLSYRQFLLIDRSDFLRIKNLMSLIFRRINAGSG